MIGQQVLQDSTSTNVCFSFLSYYISFKTQLGQDVYIFSLMMLLGWVSLIELEISQMYVKLECGAVDKAIGQSLSYCWWSPNRVHSKER